MPSLAKKMSRSRQGKATENNNIGGGQVGDFFGVSLPAYSTLYNARGGNVRRPQDLKAGGEQVRQFIAGFVIALLVVVPAAGLFLHRKS